jgi:transcription initiation factor TFIIIB Brf1 subunit/transcription initiation factor TFIIB
VKFEKQICKLLGITLPPDKAAKKVRYIASKVGMKEFVSRKAIKILDQIPSFETGPDPKGIAAAVLYLVCENTKYSVTHRELAAVTMLNSQTIGNSIKRLRNDLKKYKIKIR